MNILITGVGGPTPLGIAKSLKLTEEGKTFRLIGVDGSFLAPGLYNKSLFDNTYIIPHSSSDSYWDVIEDIVKKEAIDFAFIVPETEVLVWSKKQKEGNLPCASLIPDYDVATALYDKYKTFSLLQSTGMVPDTLEVSLDGLDDSIGNALGYPYWIRGGSGAGAIGAMKIGNLKELQNWIDINPRVKDFMASEFLPGKNYACKVLFNNGKMIKAASGERIDYLLAAAAPSGISGMCAQGKLVNDDKLVQYSEKAVRTVYESFGMQPHGMFTVDFKGDKDGEPKITEINIRHVSFTYAFALGGANFAWDTICMLKGKETEGDTIHRFDKDYRFIRGVDSDLFIIPEEELKKLN
jgi:predicted ATP-grasp superfamily ATP-dependent carboligase